MDSSILGIKLIVQHKRDKRQAVGFAKSSKLTS